MNRKGFTLVELLVAVAILGIITGMSIPIIRNIQLKQEDRKFRLYGDSLIAAAKLYRDSYEEDLFGRRPTGCAEVSYSQLKEKGLIKDFNDKNISCDTDGTKVKVVKLKKQYGYSYYLSCGEKNADGTVASTYRINSLSKKQEKVDDSIDPDTGADLCTPNGAINLTIDVQNSINGNQLNLKTDSTIKIELASSTGIRPSSRLLYAWSESNTATIAEEEWQEVRLKVPTEESQQSRINIGANVEARSSKLDNPELGTYYLYIRADQITNLNGEQWIPSEENTKYGIYGPYVMKKTYKLTYNLSGATSGSCSSKEVYQDKEGTVKWGTLCSSPKKTGYTFKEWNTKSDGSGTKITQDTTASQNLTVYAIWTLNVCTIHFDPNGGTFGGTTNTTQTMNYGSSNTNTFWNANGGSFAATRAGYTITPAQAWVRDGDNQTFDETINYAATDEVTLKVKWLGNLCTITFDPNGGTFNSNASNTTKTLRYGTPTTNTFWNANGGTYNAARVGYTIEPAQAWFRTTDNKTFDETANYAGEDVCPNLASGNKSVTLKVNWVAKSVKVTFNCNHGSGTTNKTYIAGAPGNKFINPCTRNGYTMLGWSASNTATSQTWSPLNGVTDNWISNNSPEKTIYAVWAREYTVTYKGGSNTTGSTPSTKCAYGQPITTADNGFKKPHYTFKNWEGKPDTCTGNVELTAAWRPNVAKIEYQTNSKNAVILESRAKYKKIER